MFEGKIRPCLKCGQPATILSKSEPPWVECDCQATSLRYKQVNLWNIRNTPPEELLRIKLRLEVSGLELPR